VDLRLVWLMRVGKQKEKFTGFSVGSARAGHWRCSKRYRVMLTLIDEYIHEYLAIEVKRKLNSTDVLDCLGKLLD
jgi:hypothetical protein